MVMAIWVSKKHPNGGYDTLGIYITVLVNGWQYGVYGMVV